MREVDIREAKMHLSQLVDDVAHGDEVVIAKAGKPMARLIGIPTSRQPRRRGLLKGRIHIAADVDAPLPADVLAGFEGDA